MRCGVVRSHFYDFGVCVCVVPCIDLYNKQFVKQGCIKYSYGVNMHASLLRLCSGWKPPSKSTICIWIFYRPLCFSITQLEYEILWALLSASYQQHTNDGAGVSCYLSLTLWFSFDGIRGPCYAFDRSLCSPVIYHTHKRAATQRRRQQQKKSQWKKPVHKARARLYVEAFRQNANWISLK